MIVAIAGNQLTKTKCWSIWPADGFAIRGGERRTGFPSRIRSVNRPEFNLQAIRRWLSHKEGETMYLKPGAPFEDGYAQSLHS